MGGGGGDLDGGAAEDADGGARPGDALVQLLEKLPRRLPRHEPRDVHHLAPAAALAPASSLLLLPLPLPPLPRRGLGLGRRAGAARPSLNGDAGAAGRAAARREWRTEQW